MCPAKAYAVGFSLATQNTATRTMCMAKASAVGCLLQPTAVQVSLVRHVPCKGLCCGLVYPSPSRYNLSHKLCKKPICCGRLAYHSQQQCNPSQTKASAVDLSIAAHCIANHLLCTDKFHHQKLVGTLSVRYRKEVRKRLYSCVFS